ncbi:hypothetical protein D3C79_897040 [compost metagenome]
MGNAGVDGVALPGRQVIGLPVDLQNHFAFQQGANLFPLMLDAFAGGGTRFIGFDHHRQGAIRVAVVDQLHRYPLAANLNQILTVDHNLWFIRYFRFGEKRRQ